MDENQIGTKVAQQTPTDELMRQLGATPQGLSNEEARQRLERFGANEITEKTTSPIIQFLGYLWGPIPWMIEAAAILSLVVHHWVDLGIIVTLLLFNAGVGFWQEYQAGNAVAALKKKLALKSRVLREGAWQPLNARELVPGDIIRLRAGDIIPADAKLIDGEYLSVDQSALTGESLPAGKEKDDVVYSGSIAKQGEMIALVTTTGAQTYFGRTARLVEGAGKASHFQKAVLQIGDTLIYLSLGLVAVLVIVQLFRGSGFTELLQFALILTVASIPVAMPAVLSVTMAVGAVVLSRMKAIVSRLESVEEMAGMDILCSDKTGTLTQNRLSLGEPQTFDGGDVDRLILTAALASKAENNDSIDSAVIDALDDPGLLDGFKSLAFMPFDPVGKRTEATVSDTNGHRFKVTKGAPQVIMDLAGLDHQTAQKGRRGGRRTGRRKASAPWGWRAHGEKTAHGSSWASCRCSIRRARILPKPSPRPRRMAFRSRW
jgi:H+-transporting ATPase